MIKSIKSNKFISLLLIIMCLIIIINPEFYGKSCLNAISVWGLKVLPLMFPFFVLTKLIVNLSRPQKNIMDKFFNKLYHTPYGSFSTFFLSVLSGYPMGAKLITGLYESKHIEKNDAEKMLAFCSVSGPMFMIGTVGVAMLRSYKAGLIILISNIIACLINGFIYRGKTSSLKDLKQLQKNTNFSLADCVYDSLVSVLMVGAYIVISFIVVDILKNLNILTIISKTTSCVFNNKVSQDVIESILCGGIEITRGIFDLSSLQLPLKYKTIISSSLIGFGGFCIMLQSIGFLKSINISFKKIFKQKITQCFICLIISTILCFIFM